ncbi:IucA/IucC family C-terminal-domain containing protein [Thermaerobacter subterraneus]|nr:IucA/IucC family C-terminal-domain containing protein [Thermaerobacter subterraneus]
MVPCCPADAAALDALTTLPLTPGTRRRLLVSLAASHLDAGAGGEGTAGGKAAAVDTTTGDPEGAGGRGTVGALIHPSAPLPLLRDPAHLRRVIAGLRIRWGGPVEAVASQWHKHYGAAALTAPLLAMTGAGVALAAPGEETVVILEAGPGRNAGLPVGIGARLLGHRSQPRRGRISLGRPQCRPPLAGETGPGALPAASAAGATAVPEAATGCGAPVPRAPWMDDLLGLLLEEYVAPMVAALHQATGLRPATLWTNTANFCASLYEELAGAAHPAGERRGSTTGESSGARAPLAAVPTGLREAAAHDAAWLLTAPTLAGFDPNPLAGRIEYVECPWRDAATPSARRVRRACCLRFRLSEGKPCRCCPLRGRGEVQARCADPAPPPPIQSGPGG